MEEVLVGSLAQPYIYGKYLFVADYRSSEKLIHIFDKHSFRYLLSFGDIGQGPREISSLGTIAWNEKEHDLLVTDHGQRRILSYNLDSLLNDSLYSPYIKLSFKEGIFRIIITISLIRCLMVRLYNLLHLLLNKPLENGI